MNFFFIEHMWEYMEVQFGPHRLEIEQSQSLLENSK